MKKILFFLILSIFFLSGCIHIFVLPDDAEFLALIEELNTPRKACQYMLDNFVYRPNILKPINPYQLYLCKMGDCDDFSNWGVFFANYHNYETYQIKIYYKNTPYSHSLAVYKENGRYNFSNNQYYLFIQAENFEYIVIYDSYFLMEREWIKYIVYDYGMNVIEIGYNKI
ncbi:MAG: hypothetical protein E3J83_03360 [Candidatus Atribacteria bacterium]|nr:MAG: hypothetical protein E3J83_03360 [Candidatus Atribacteria bacterium]